MTPKSWRIETIQSLIDSMAITGHQDGNHGSLYPRTSEFGTEGVPFLTAKLLRDGGVDVESAPRLASDRADKLRIGFTEPGDVLLAHNAIVGRVAIVPDYDGRLLLGTSLTYFRLDQSKISTRYFAAQLAGPMFQNQLKAVMSHSTRDQVPITAQRRLRIVLPPLSEQQVIADLLGPFNDKIKLNRQLNETLEAMACTLFKSWFIDFDPVRAKMAGRATSSITASIAEHVTAILDNTAAGPIPRGWRHGVLEELQGSQPSAITAGPFGSKLVRADYVERGIPVVRGANLGGVPGEWFSEDDFVYVSQEKVARDLASCVARRGDVLFTQRGTLGQVGMIPFDAEHAEYVISQSQMKMTCADWVPPEYVVLVFKQPETLAYIQANAVAVGVPHINLGFLRRFPVLVPPEEILRAFGAVIRPLQLRMRANVVENRILTKLRDTLLPRLLSGELRLRDAEREVGKVA